MHNMLYMEVEKTLVPLQTKMFYYAVSISGYIVWAMTIERATPSEIKNLILFFDRIKLWSLPELFPY